MASRPDRHSPLAVQAHLPLAVGAEQNALPQTPELYFFYGSLRTGLVNHDFIRRNFARVESLGEYVTDLEYTLIGLASRAYPFMTAAAPPGSCSLIGATRARITGEVFALDVADGDGLRSLDALEGGYAKRQISVSRRSDGLSTVVVWVYLMENPETIASFWENRHGRFVAVPDGDWRTFGGK